MRVQDRIALGSMPESSLADVDHAEMVQAKSTGTQVLSVGGDVRKDGDVYWFKLSTESVNRRGDIIRQKGLDFTNWNKTPVVLHNHDDEFPIGMGQIRRNGSETLMGVQFSSVNPRAVMVRAMLDEGMPMAASIAILPTKVSDPPQAERKQMGLGPYGVVYERAEVIEGSVVTVPADPDAVRQALKHAQVASDSTDVERFIERLSVTEMDLAKRLRAERKATSADIDEPAWLDRLEAALDRCAFRIEHAVRGGIRREPAGSEAATPSAGAGIDLSVLLQGLTKEVESRTARKDTTK